MYQMLEKKREYHLGKGELLSFRIWQAMTHGTMQGLAHGNMQEPPSTVGEFLALNRFVSARDEENRGSGYTPLIYAAMSGNLPVVRELIDRNSVDVRARVRVDVQVFGGEKGMDALAIAAACCPQRQVHNVVTELLAAGADPNVASSRNGTTPLIAAIGMQNLGGVCALLACDTIDLEKGFRMNNASPLNIAGYMATLEIVKALIEAGVNKAHRHVWSHRKWCTQLLTVCDHPPSLQTRQWRDYLR